VDAELLAVERMDRMDGWGVLTLPEPSRRRPRPAIAGRAATQTASSANTAPVLHRPICARKQRQKTNTCGVAVGPQMFFLKMSDVALVCQTSRGRGPGTRVTRRG